MASRRRGVLLSLATLGLALVLAGPAHADHNYLIEASGNLPANLGATVASYGGTLQRTMPELGLAVASAPNPSFGTAMSGESGILSVTEDPAVQWVPGPDQLAQDVVDVTASGASVPNPAGAVFFNCQWSLQRIQAPGAWAQGVFGSPKVKVAVLDTGVDPSHIDLRGKVDIAHSKSVLTPGSSPCGAPDETSFVDRHFHGTFVSSLITSNNLGIAGVAPSAQLVGVKVLNCRGSGSFGDVIAGIHYAAGLDDVSVINMSLGAVIPNTKQFAPFVRAISKAVAFADHHGKLVVAAAGNNALRLTNNGSLIELPGQAEEAIAITATSIVDTLASYSNFGEVTWVGAPGGDLPNPAPPLPGCPLNSVPGFPPVESLIIGACAPALCGGHTNRYVLGAGTSFASPVVAGVAELVDSSGGNGNFPPDRVKQILRGTADQIGPESVFAGGRVNASQAVEDAGHN